MRYLFLLAIMLTALLLPAQTANQANIAVLELKAIGVQEATASILTNKLTSVLNATGKYRILERDRINSLMQEQGLQTSGTCTTSECLSQIGGLLGAQKMITGSIGVLGGVYAISLRLFDVETAATDKTVSKEAECSEKELFTLLEIAGYELAGLVSDKKMSVKSDNQAKQVETNQVTTNDSQPAAGSLGNGKLILVEGGSFSMGDTFGLGEGQPDEKPLHIVTLSSFLLAPTEVTQEEFYAITGINRSYYKNDKAPVEKVSWYDAVNYCNQLSKNEGLQPVYTIDKSRRDPNNSNAKDNQKWIITWDNFANGYRLPTEAEWEYAARGGKKSQNFKYSGSVEAAEVGWFSVNSANQPKQKQSNELGIYDMSGNVWEWCWDWYGAYNNKPLKDPQGPNWGARRVIRGGGWTNPEIDLRVCNRGDTNYEFAGDLNLGFRVVRSILK